MIRSVKLVIETKRLRALRDTLVANDLRMRKGAPARAGTQPPALHQFILAAEKVVEIPCGVRDLPGERVALTARFVVSG